LFGDPQKNIVKMNGKQCINCEARAMQERRHQVNSNVVAANFQLVGNHIVSLSTFKHLYLPLENFDQKDE
jgi:hypothetical protein